MNLDNYKKTLLSIVKNANEEGIIYLATNDHTEATKVAEAYNNIATIEGRKAFFYVANIIAYFK